MTDYRLTAADHATLLADLDDAASRAGGLLSRVTRPRALLRSLGPWVDVEPEPAPATLIGACPLTGGMSAAAGQRVIDRWDVHESIVDEAPITGGRHTLRVEYFERVSWAELRVEIVKP